MKSPTDALRPPHLLTADEIERELWKVVSADPVLSKHIRQDHPFFRFQLLHLGESLTFRVGVHGLTPWASGTAFCYQLNRQIAESAEEKRFIAGLRSTLRALLFWEIGADYVDARNSLELIASGTVLWEQVRQFLTYCLVRLPLETRFEEDGHTLSVHFQPLAAEVDPEAPVFAPFLLTFGKAEMVRRYAGAGPDWLTVSTVALRDHLLIYLCRAFLEMVTPEQAELQLVHGRQARENAQAAAAMLRGQITADPAASQQVHKNLSARLLERLSVADLPAG